MQSIARADLPTGPGPAPAAAPAGARPVDGLLADQRDLVDAERLRLARELHDSVAHYILSAGMAVELARGDAEALGRPGRRIQQRLGTAQQLTQEAVDQLRRAIYALHQPHRDRAATLPELLGELAHRHEPHLPVSLRVEGRVVALPDGAEHELARTVGEALFNVATHARASRAVVRLRYLPDRIVISVADDGCGDPTDLSRRLRRQRVTVVDGRHRGLVNMDARVGDLGGTLAFRRARLGGVSVEVRVPLGAPPPAPSYDDQRQA